MNISAIPFGVKVVGPGESEVVSLVDAKNGLIICVKKYLKNSDSVSFEITFETNEGYRVMNEGDLRRYENCEIFHQSYCVYEIVSGGWSSGEKIDDEILNLVKVRKVREWLVTTTNGSVNVLSNSMPAIKSL